MLSVPILLFAVVASQLDQEPPILRASTPKSLQEFSACFARSQDEASRAWAFMPTETGGTFTNVGASGAAQPYWLRVSEAKPISQLRLFASKDSSDVLKAVNKCR